MPALYTSQVFPGGRQKTITISPTAGNVVTRLTPGIGLRWVLVRGQITLVCDATVATRIITMSFDDGVNNTDSGIGGANCVAGNTTGLSIGKTTVSAGSVYNDYATVNPGTDQTINGAERMNISIAAGVAGDTYSGRIVVREMAVE